MRELVGIGKNSSNTVLDTLEPVKIKSRQTSKQGITVVKMTCPTKAFAAKRGASHEIPSESLKIPDINKTSLTSISDMASEGKIRLKPNTKVLNCLSR